MADDTRAGLTREQAAVILQDAVPGTKVIGVERMAGGIEDGAYEVLCADPLQNAVVKVYGKDAGWKLLKEIGVYRLLRENAITQLPNLLGGDGPNGVLGRPYLVMSKLPGTSVEAISSTLPDAELADVYRQMGALLARIHAIGQEAYGYLASDIIDPQPSSGAHMKATLSRVSKSYLDATGDRELYEGYGEVPVEWERRFRLFELVQSFELWDFFHAVGMRDKLDPLADELRAVITAD